MAKTPAPRCCPAGSLYTAAEWCNRRNDDKKRLSRCESDANERTGTLVLSRLAEAAGTPYYVPKSRLAFDLIPLLLSLLKEGAK